MNLNQILMSLKYFKLKFKQCYDFCLQEDF